MSKKKDKVEVQRFLTPAKAKFMKLHEPSDETIKKEMDRDWTKEPRVFVDCGEFYAYNPKRPDFMEGHRLFRDAIDASLASLILSVLAKMATASGVSAKDLDEWMRQQRLRWSNERKWERLDG